MPNISLFRELLPTTYVAPGKVMFFTSVCQSVQGRGGRGRGGGLLCPGHPVQGGGEGGVGTGKVWSAHLDHTPLILPLPYPS